jgi:two-component system, chemotaxis family, response regulator Rcp1
LNNRDGALPGLEVLLVENNVSDVLLMVNYLKECPVKTSVNVARDGQEALDYLSRVHGYEQAKRPDLVLLNPNLPHQDGYELLRQMKVSPELRTIRVIILTDSAAPEDAFKALQLEADDFLVKPHDMAEFDALIKNLEETWLKKLLSSKKDDEDNFSFTTALE